jgi:hypothetical protein
MTASAYGATFAALAWMMSRVARRQVLRPLLSVTAAEPMARELAWLRELSRIERRVAGRPAHGTLSRMVEQYLLLVREAPHVDGALEARLRQVLEHAAALIELGAELEDGLDAGMLARQAATWTALGDELDGETDRARRDALEQRRRQVRAVLEQSYELEDARVGLIARLAGLQSTFDRLLGKLLVLRAPLEAGDAAMVEGAVREARLELQAARAAVAALAEAA